MPKITYEFTSNDRKNIAAAVRDAIAANAALWDVLGSIEDREGIEIEVKPSIEQFVSVLTLQSARPSTMNALEFSDASILEAFDAKSEVRL